LYAIPPLVLSTEDLVSNAIAVLALLCSGAAYWASRRHADRLFESKEYPEILIPSISIWAPGEFLTDLLRHGEKRLGHSQQVEDHEARLILELENPTEVRAVGVRLTIRLAKGTRRVRFSVVPVVQGEPGVFSPSKGTERFEQRLNKALSLLSPTTFQCRTLGPGSAGQCRWLEVPPGEKPTRVHLSVALEWQAPLSGSRTRRKYIGGVMRPVLLKDELVPARDKFGRPFGTVVQFDGKLPVIEWSLIQHSSMFLHRLRAWRLRTEDIQHDVL
jgi:hypothetical protein